MLLLPAKTFALTGEEKDSLVIHFPVRVSDIDLSFRNNRAILDAFITRYRRQFGHVNPDFLQIDVESGASPEGPSELNKRLALRRAEAVRKLLIERLGSRAPLIVENVRPIGWQRFRDMIAESSEPWRNEVVEILNKGLQSPLGPWEIDPREKQLRRLRGGTVWPILLERYLQPLRSSAAAIVHWREGADTVFVRDTIVQERERIEYRVVRDTIFHTPTAAVVVRDTVPTPVVIHDTITYIMPEPAAVHCQGVALRTNLVYVATLSPNVTIDAGLSCHWSAVLSTGFNFWKLKQYYNEKGKVVNPKFMHWSIVPELRYWPNEHLEGFFAGLQGYYAMYNVGGIKELKAFKNHRYDGWLAGAGIAVGWQWWLDRYHRWGVETSLAGGYVYLNYKDYPPCSCGDLRQKVAKNYYGLTNLVLALTYRIK